MNYAFFTRQPGDTAESSPLALLASSIESKEVITSSVEAKDFKITGLITSAEIKNSGTIETKNIDLETINSSGYCANPATANLNMGTIFSIQNCNEVTTYATNTKTIQSGDLDSVVVNSNVSMGNNSISFIDTATMIDMKSTGEISAKDIKSNGTFDGKDIIASATVEAKDMRLTERYTPTKLPQSRRQRH